MAGTLKKVRIVVACAYGDVGREFTPNGTLRDWLLAQGYAVVVNGHDLNQRPAKLAGKAARKIADATGKLFGGKSS